MQAKEIMMFTLAFSLAITAVNSIGLFDVDGADSIIPLETGSEVDRVISNSIDGVHEIDSGLMSDDDAADSITGTSMLWQALSTIKTMLTLTLLPGVYLKGIGVPAYFYVPIQVIINATTVWGLFQIITGRYTRSAD